MNVHQYLPQDRLRALIRKQTMPDRTTGSALFADISGFTPLTESLRNLLGARRGAEELTRHLESVYTALIFEIDRYGGSVIDFAGDSMMCWFDQAVIESAGKPAAFPAVVCGLAMQKAMQAFSHIELPDHSTTALGLKVAIASGPARRFVVGDPEIQQIDALAGSTIARTATAEHLTQKGEVIIDSATAESVGDFVHVVEWREDETQHERFAVIDALNQAEPPVQTPPLQLETLSPEELRAWLPQSLYEREMAGQAEFLTEFRPCTAMFLRFIGIEYDLDEAGNLLNAFVSQAQRIVEQRGGTFLQITIGDKGSYAYINFGVLKTHEDDARRAINAALDLRDTARELGFLQPLQIGITQGTLRVGNNGGKTRRSYGAMGDEVNLAARLMQNAAPDEILISGRVQKAAEQDFVFEPRMPLPMKGKAEPLPVFVVTERRAKQAARLQEPQYALPMAGRQSELSLIGEKLDLALQNKAQVISITAEAGMGKSRLVAEVIRLARKKGFTGYGGACQSDSIHTSYFVWKPVWGAFFNINPEFALRKQLRYLEGEMEDRAPQRMDAIPLLKTVLDLDIPDNEFTQTLDPQQRKSVLHAMLEECLRSAAKDESLLIVLEDAHWMDSLSFDLLDDLTKMLSDSPVCFLLARRPNAENLQQTRLEALGCFTEIDLKELNRAEAEGAIRAKLAQLYPARSGKLHPHLIDTLMERAQGNPFYLEELLNFLHDRGLDPFDAEDLSQVELPESLHTLILSRIDQLSEQDKTTLRVASIIGRVFRVDWLTGYYPALSNIETLKSDLDKLGEMDITPVDLQDPEISYLFKHIVLHEVTYESLPFSLRAKLHEQLANYLENQIAAGTIRELSLLNVLVYHYSHSQNHEKQRIYLKKAGDAALDISAFSAAADYFTRLVNLTNESDPDYSALVLKIADAQYRLGNTTNALASIEKAHLFAQSDMDKISASVLQGEITGNLGSYADAERILSETIHAARTVGAPALLSRALYALGSNFWRQGDLKKAYVYLKESLQSAQEAEDLTRELFALNGLGGVEMRNGDIEKAKELWQEVYVKAKASGNRERAMAALNNLGGASEQENISLTREYTTQALSIAREIGAQRNIALYLINLANADIKLGNFDSAKNELREGFNLSTRLGAMPWVVSIIGNLAELCHAEGSMDRAVQLWAIARNHPAWNNEHQRQLEAALNLWEIEEETIQAAMLQNKNINWEDKIKEFF